MYRDRLDDPWVLCKPSIHAGLTRIDHLLASGQRAHRAVFLQCNGVLRGADLAAVVEGKKKDK